MNRKRKWIILLCVLLGGALLAAIAYFGTRGNAGKKEGSASFIFEMVDGAGNVKSWTVTSDRTYVGEALLDEKLIEGEEGPYGLYVKFVDGIRADYELDGHYWAFYENGEYAVTGCELTPITEGAIYSFKYE